MQSIIHTLPRWLSGKESVYQCRRSQFDSWVRKIPWRRDRPTSPVFLGFPGSSDGKESACNVGDLDLIPGLGRSPGGGHGNPLQYSCLENPHGQRSLVGYCPWGSKESDTTNQLSTEQQLHTALCKFKVYGTMTQRKYIIKQLSQLSLASSHHFT